VGKHGIRQAGFFTTLVGVSNQELTYFLAWESMAERETKWTAFATDPAWLTARTETEKDGQIVDNIVNQFLQPTAFPRSSKRPHKRIWRNPRIAIRRL
jgi:NIPSNAP.